MNEEIEALRKSMRSAQPVGRGQYIDNGQHLYRIKLAKRQATDQQGTIKESWIAELEIVKSTNPAAEAGTSRVYIESPKNDGWMGRWKAFLMAACGIPSTKKLTNEEEDVIADVHAALRSEDFRKAKQFPENFLAGRYVYCEATPGKSRSGGNVTHKKWEPAEAPAVA